jgi:hypothetical protein
MVTMSSRERTPSHGAGAEEFATPSASSSESSLYPESSESNSLTTSPARTPGGSIRACTDDATEMITVKVHTAKCTDCDKRNTDIMSRCPGCTFQICKNCKEKREKRFGSLAHGNMLTPGGIGTGEAVRRRLLGMKISPAPEDINKELQDQEEKVGGVKGKGKAVASKKRTASKVVVYDDSSDDFTIDAASPTANKRRRTGASGITDTPTATSTRPSRTASHSTTAPIYIASSSPSSGNASGPGSSEAMPASSDNSPLDRNLEYARTASIPEVREFAPTGRIQELLEQHGVNTADNRYQQHFLERFTPVVDDPLMRVPHKVKRMADKTPRLSSVEKWEARNAELLVSKIADNMWVHVTNINQLEAMDKARADNPLYTQEKAEEEERVKILTAREFTYNETSKYLSDDLDEDENEALRWAIREAARKWTIETYKSLSPDNQNIVARGLDMRLDQMDEEYETGLAEVIEYCALRKRKEIDGDRRGGAA